MILLFGLVVLVPPTVRDAAATIMDASLVSPIFVLDPIPYMDQTTTNSLACRRLTRPINI